MIYVSRLDNPCSTRRAFVGSGDFLSRVQTLRTKGSWVVPLTWVPDDSTRTFPTQTLDVERSRYPGVHRTAALRLPNREWVHHRTPSGREAVDGLEVATVVGRVATPPGGRSDDEPLPLVISSLSIPSTTLYPESRRQGAVADLAYDPVTSPPLSSPPSPFG